MFLNLPPEMPVSSDWLSTDFGTRIGALRSGLTRVAFYYDYPDASTFRYRVHNVVEVLRAGHASKARPEISAAWFCHADGLLLSQVAEAADILVLCRARYSARINELITRAKNLNRRVLFDVDDLVIDLRHAHLIVHTLDQEIHNEDVWNYWFSYIGRVGTVMRMCDQVITTNEFLAEQIRHSSNMKVSIVPNFLNKKQLKYSDIIYEAKLGGGFARDKHMHIGYFSGSPSHNKDFSIVSGPLARIMKEYRSVRLVLVGYLDIQGPVSKYSNQIDRINFQDYINLQRTIGMAELNIVPLQDNVFTNCKSELKYFEAAAVGTPTLASSTFVFNRIIGDDENGWLARNYDWYERIATVIEHLHDDPSRVFELISQARDHARSLFSWENQYPTIRAALLDG